jgi:hypothetical protein
MSTAIDTLFGGIERTAPTELAHRSAAGIDVLILWDRDTGRLRNAVEDRRTGDPSSSRPPAVEQALGSSTIRSPSDERGPSSRRPLVRGPDGLVASRRSAAKLLPVPAALPATTFTPAGEMAHHFA